MTPREDDELESLLRRYEPAGPPASLRSRVIAASVRGPRTWPWAVAAAALVASTVWLHDTTERTVNAQTMDSAVTPAVNVLADLMGGGDEARLTAQRIIAMDEAARLNAQPVGTAGSEGDAR